ncbi:hypothetical protein AB674_04135 [Flavobacterium sp. ABG]|nr:hypothetical protein AB674_04135 [Flavobacterium sp. ABG]
MKDKMVLSEISKISPICKICVLKKKLCVFAPLRAKTTRLPCLQVFHTKFARPFYKKESKTSRLRAFACKKKAPYDQIPHKYKSQKAI